MNNILHIYGQYEEHDDIEIAGDREALMGLKEAIDAALETKNGESEPYTNDGEGYTIHVTMLTSDEAERIKTPYAYKIVDERCAIFEAGEDI